MGIARQHNLVPLPGGTFSMGSDRHYAEESPAHPVSVEPFEIAVTTVTNQQFADFVAETRYSTTAEIPLKPDRNNQMPADYFTAGSLVFQKTDGPVDLQDFRNWWRFVPGTCWKAPEGPGSSIEDRQDHPVVHVSLFDAFAYAKWAGLALPSEAEWEYAARDGVDTTFPWGEALTPDGIALANTWQGQFPWQNDRTENAPFSMPARCFRASRYGLFNMIGNVWEWTSDKFVADHAQAGPCCSPAGPRDGEHYVAKGGSFLCAPSYCRRYRASARSPQEARSSTSHLGFRCIRREMC